MLGARHRICLPIYRGNTPALIDEIPPICEGESVNLQAYGTDALQWQPDPTLDDPTGSQPLSDADGNHHVYGGRQQPVRGGEASVTVVVEVLVDRHFARHDHLQWRRGGA